MDENFMYYTTGRGLIYKEFQKLNNSKTNNPVKQWVKDMNRYFSKMKFKRLMDS